MKAKIFEIRDKGTFIPMLAVQLDPSGEDERYLLSRAGYGRSRMEQKEYIQLIRINGGSGMGHCDYYEWGNRTMANAHKHIIEHWDILETGAVIDVEFILGETSKSKVSEKHQNLI